MEKTLITISLLQIVFPRPLLPHDVFHVKLRIWSLPDLPNRVHVVFGEGFQNLEFIPKCLYLVANVTKLPFIPLSEARITRGNTILKWVTHRYAKTILPCITYYLRTLRVMKPHGFEPKRFRTRKSFVSHSDSTEEQAYSDLK